MENPSDIERPSFKYFDEVLICVRRRNLELYERLLLKEIFYPQRRSSFSDGLNLLEALDKRNSHQNDLGGNVLGLIEVPARRELSINPFQLIEAIKEKVSGSFFPFLVVDTECSYTTSYSSLESPFSHILELLSGLLRVPPAYYRNGPKKVLQRASNENIPTIQVTALAIEETLRVFLKSLNF